MAAACQFCRLRKTKCDAARPTCGYCSYHQARCVYDDQQDNEVSQAPDDTANFGVELGAQILSSLGEIKQLLTQPRQVAPASISNQQFQHHQQQQHYGVGAGGLLPARRLARWAVPRPTRRG